jgi:hypothetical protein
VYLKDGRILRGTISQNIPGKFVRIDTHDDQSVMLKWDEVDRVATESVKKSSSGRASTSSTSVSSGSSSGGSARSKGYRSSGSSRSSSSSVALATNFDPGYKLLLETGYDFGVGLSRNRFKLNVINSYQFIPILITGIGVGTRIKVFKIFDETSVDFSFPLFVDLRAVILEGRFSPYVSTGLGTSLSEKFKSLGFFANPGLGVRYWLNDRLGLNFGLNYEVTRRSTRTIIGNFVTKSEAVGLTFGVNF